MYICMQIMNPFPVNNFPYSLKSTENMWFSGPFRGYKGVALWHGMEKCFNLFAACM